MAPADTSGVLADLGEPGLAALRQGLARARDVRTRSLIEDTPGDDPARRPLAEYPPTDQERRRIRGCPPAR